MVNANPSHPNSRVQTPGLSPAALGTACCILSALGYTGANVCMRQLAALDCDPTWAACTKELVTVLVVGPWLLVQAIRGLPTLPGGRPLVMLVLVGLATQLGGNVGVQWAYGKVGLAVVIPAVFALMITTSAVMGRVLLGERVSPRSAAAIGLLLAALGLLGLGAAGAGRGTVETAGANVVAPEAAAKDQSTDAGPLEHRPEACPTLVAAAAVGLACLAGAIYSLLSITIRHCVTGDTRLSAVLIIITAMGVLSLGPLSVYRLGLPALWQTPTDQLLWMLAAGSLNLVAFLAVSKGLQLTTVVHANMLNASQVALAAVAGIAVFQEKPNPWLVLGVALTILGIVSVGRPTSEPIVDQHA